jgi:hypothetical protein
MEQPATSEPEQAEEKPLPLRRHMPHTDSKLHMKRLWSLLSVSNQKSLINYYIIMSYERIFSQEN